MREERLDAFEYQAVQCCAKPQIERKAAEKFGLEAKQNDGLLSLHGSYSINLHIQLHSHLAKINKDVYERLIYDELQNMIRFRNGSVMLAETPRAQRAR